MMKASKGQVLMSTVITGLIIAIIAAGLMRLVFMRYTASAKVKVQAENTRCLQMAVGQFFSYWTSSPVCSSNPGVFACQGGVPGHCSCHCTFSNGNLNGLTIQVSPGPQGGIFPPCAFQVTSSDMMNPPIGCQ